jgi:CheY-like chemotaxis protein
MSTPSGSSSDIPRALVKSRSNRLGGRGTVVVDGLHILVVDDESTNRRLCDRMLTRLKCSVTCLEDGDEVLGELQRCCYCTDVSSAAEPLPPFQRVDVILLDIMMRRSNGVDVAVELRRVFSSAAVSSSGAAAVARHRDRRQLPPIVAMTGNTSLANIETYKRAGFCHVLPKPFDIAALQSTLEVCRHISVTTVL